VEENLREERGVRDRRAAMDAGARMAIIGMRRARFDAIMARGRRIWLRDSVHCYRRTSFFCRELRRASLGNCDKVAV